MYYLMAMMASKQSWAALFPTVCESTTILKDHSAIEDLYFTQHKLGLFGLQSNNNKGKTERNKITHQKKTPKKQI